MSLLAKLRHFSRQRLDEVLANWHDSAADKDRAKATYALVKSCRAAHCGDIDSSVAYLRTATAADHRSAQHRCSAVQHRIRSPKGGSR